MIAVDDVHRLYQSINGASQVLRLSGKGSGPMDSVAAELAAVLATVRRPGDFFAAGTTEFLAPRLEVNGVGQIALPLQPFQVAQLVAAAERAPYGRGEKTLVDPTVRRTWQIGPGRVRVEGRGWERTLNTILTQVAAGLGVAELTGRWAASGEGDGSPLWRQAHELSGQILSRWTLQESYPSSKEATSHAARMLTLLTELGDIAHIEAALADSSGGYIDKSDNDVIIRAVGLLSRRQAAAWIERIIAGTVATSLSACGDLLALAVSRLRQCREADFVGAATALVEALPGDPRRRPVEEAWRWNLRVEPGFVVDLLSALGHIDERLLERAADHILAWPKTYSLDGVVIPAMRELIGSTAIQRPSVQRLRMACLAHLRARLAEPLEAPSDWRRASALPCRCPYCSELSDYLADPGRETWTLKAAESIRSHVQNTIQQAHCDVDVTTDRRGRPYALVCTKNQATAC